MSARGLLALHSLATPLQSFDERLEQAVSAIRCLEEKTLNLARLVSVAQQYAEQQEGAAREAQGELRRRLGALEARLAELEEPGRAAEWEAKLRAGGCGCGGRAQFERVPA